MRHVKRSNCDKESGVDKLVTAYCLSSEVLFKTKRFVLQTNDIDKVVITFVIIINAIF